MVRRALICIVLGSAALGVRPSDDDATAPLLLHVSPEGWGTAPPANAEAVLRSAAGVILRHIPDRALDPIHVQPGGGPIVLYARAADGGYQVRLATQDTRWAQCAFQFAHELGHILCGYDAVTSGNHFLEEAICETASLFALRAMARDWKDAPPYPNWTSYAVHLHQYAQDRIDNARLPEAMSLADWYAANADALRANAADRDRNLVIAAQLLPLFEADPENAWAAVGYLNAAEPAEAQDFAAHLQRWHDVTPQPQRAFIRVVARRFGITLDAGEPG